MVAPLTSTRPLAGWATTRSLAGSGSLSLTVTETTTGRSRTVVAASSTGSGSDLATVVVGPVVVGPVVVGPVVVGSVVVVVGSLVGVGWAVNVFAVCGFAHTAAEGPMDKSAGLG
jgi:hypothetical protein